MRFHWDRIEVSVDESGHSALCCLRCHQPGEHAITKEANGIVEFGLSCPICGVVFGTWANEHKRSCAIGSVLGRIPKRYG
jgi:hypothetical protein